MQAGVCQALLFLNPASCPPPCFLGTQWSLLAGTEAVQPHLSREVAFRSPEHEVSRVLGSEEVGRSYALEVLGPSMYSGQVTDTAYGQETAWPRRLQGSSGGPWTFTAPQGGWAPWHITVGNGLQSLGCDEGLGVGPWQRQGFTSASLL